MNAGQVLTTKKLTLANLLKPALENNFGWMELHLSEGTGKKIFIFVCFFVSYIFFNVGLPKEDIILTTIYGLYFSHQLHIHFLQITI